MERAQAEDDASGPEGDTRGGYRERWLVFYCQEEVKAAGWDPSGLPVADAPASLEDAFTQSFVATQADGDPRWCSRHRGSPRNEP